MCIRDSSHTQHLAARRHNTAHDDINVTSLTYLSIVHVVRLCTCTQTQELTHLYSAGYRGRWSHQSRVQCKLHRAYTDQQHTPSHRHTHLYHFITPRCVQACDVIATSLGLPQTLCQFSNPHTCDYLCWKADEVWSSSCWWMDDNRQIEAQLQRNFRSSPKFYTI